MREINDKTREHFVTYTNRIPPTHSRKSPPMSLLSLYFAMKELDLWPCKLQNLTLL